MQNRKVLKIAAKSLSDKKLLLFFLLILKTISVGLGIMTPYMVGEVIDQLADISVGKIMALVILLATSLIVDSIVTYQLALLGQRAAIYVRNRLWNKILNLETPYYDKTHSGELSSRVINDTSSLSSFLTCALPDFCASVLTLVLMISILFSLDKWLGAIFCMIFPLIILVMIPVADKIRDLAIVQQEIYAKLNEMLTETLEHIKFVKAYNAEESEEKRVVGKMEEWFQNSKKYSLVHAILSPVMGGITSLALFTVCGIGAYRVHMGYITAGTIIIFALYLVNAIEPVEVIGNFLMEYKELQGALHKVNEIFDVDIEKTEGDADGSREKRLTFNHVEFGYRNQPIIKDISFIANTDQKIAIVGESGAGKTTIFSLIERFYEASEGCIKWGDQPIDSFQIHEWRNNIGYVFQDKMLVSGTIRDNLVYGIDRVVKEEELADATKMANIYDFIISQDKSFDAYVGEKGDLLSGGQKQRIAIARMFLRNPAILLLDEITANLDAESEQQVSKSLENLYKERITLIIAHKLRTVMDADRILVIQDGCIVGNGSHNELMETNQYYQKVIKYEFKR